MFTYKGENKKPDALDRAYYFLRSSSQDIPPLAGEFAKMFCSKRSAFAFPEFAISAYAIYAQLEEGCPCRDAFYVPNEEDKELFYEIKNARN